MASQRSSKATNAELRLARVATGHTPATKEALARIEAEVGHVDEVDVLLHYRPELFGGPHIETSEAVMRGPSDWTIGERELFAAFVSSLNQCPF